MMKWMEHTFAICAYKESPYLEECVISLMKQTVKSNIILVTSTPNQYIEDISKKYELPYFINTGEKGITQDWNFAYKMANNKFITIAHQDDIYQKEYTETVMNELKRVKKPLIFFSDYFEIRDGKHVEKNRLLFIKRLMLIPLRIKLCQRSIWVRRRILSLGTPICCPSVTFASEYLPKEVFKHNFRACEDWEAWEMLSKIKGQFVYSTKLLMGHRIHEESETSSIIGDNMRSNEEYVMFCKFWPKSIAKVLGKVYAKSQQSNDLTE